MNIILIHCLILFINILQSNAYNKARCAVTDDIQVHVVNSLPFPELTLHCASKDNDLGYYNTTQNFDFHWRFCDSYLGVTLFFCHLTWGDKNVAFDVYTSKNREQCLRGMCNWEARPDGIYFAGGIPPVSPVNFKKMHDWKNNV
ncbi:hypothetical protein ACP275_06G191300 [Erythranthe tilingii]